MDIDAMDVITDAIMGLVNDYPALNGESILFATLNEDRGKAFFPINGAVTRSDVKDITGHRTQICTYPFLIVYRSGNLNETRRRAVKEWLDNLGRWMEKQTITVGGVEHTLGSYPALTGTRRFSKIERDAPAYLDNVGSNNCEDWAISITAEYINEF